MPRIKELKKDYMLKDMREWMIGRMKSLGIKQCDMADMLGISQPAFGQRLRTSNFRTDQLIDIFKRLQATDEEILRFIKLSA